MNWYTYFERSYMNSFVFTGCRDRFSLVIWNYQLNSIYYSIFRAMFDQLLCISFWGCFMHIPFLSVVESPRSIQIYEYYFKKFDGHLLHIIKLSIKLSISKSSPKYSGEKIIIVLSDRIRTGHWFYFMGTLL